MRYFLSAILGLISFILVNAAHVDTRGTDTHSGTDRNDPIQGRGGNDRITPGQGDDVVYSGPGAGHLGGSRFSWTPA